MTSSSKKEQEKDKIRLPIELEIDQIERTNRSHFPGKVEENRFKTLIKQSFSMSKNNSLIKVCQHISENSLKTHYPSGSKFKTMQLCAIVESS